MGYPEDLLEQSKHLARRERLRPRQASLRRAVSTAYYALFHLLTTELGKNWRQVSSRAVIERLPDHGSMNRVCDQFGRKYARTSSQVEKDLFAVAQTFTEMYEHRQVADYDNSQTWVRTDVNLKIALVEAAFQSWKRVRAEQLAQDFLAAFLKKR